MVAFKNLALLAIAGSAVAQPAAAHKRGNEVHKHVVWETVVKTAYVTVYPGAYTPAPVPTSTAVAYTPAPTTTKSSAIKKKQRPHKPSSSSVYVAPEPTPEPTPSSTVVEEKKTSEAPTPYEPEPTPTPTPSPEPEAPTTGSGYMALANEWRKKLGLKEFEHDDQLESNAYKTCQDGHGQMVHQLNEGTMGQVLAPGGPDDFYHVFVGGWLCEKPNLAGLAGVCSSASQGWTYTSTGHADILTSEKYTKMGCACVEEIWGCDLA